MKQNYKIKNLIFYLALKYNIKYNIYFIYIIQQIKDLFKIILNNINDIIVKKIFFIRITV